MYYCRVFFIEDQQKKSIYIISEKFLAFLGLKPRVMMLKELRSLANRPDIEQKIVKCVAPTPLFSLFQKNDLIKRTIMILDFR